jgi:hypothetical protein
VNELLPHGQFLLHILIDANMPNALYSLIRIVALNPNRSSCSFPHPLHYIQARKAVTPE